MYRIYWDTLMSSAKPEPGIRELMRVDFLSKTIMNSGRHMDSQVTEMKRRLKVLTSTGKETQCDC